ncbi:MAG: hypothetical protein ACE37F_00845 [Nannocystaceae bacterium]|nr:hypothetical protein [bacterium]
MNSTTTTLLLPLASALALLASACTVQVVNGDHCANNEGDAYCSELFPERPFCNSGLRNDECDIGHLGETIALYGCVSAEELRCPEPCGVDPTCEGPESSSSSGSGSETGSDTTTVEPSTTVEPETDTEDPSTTTGPECMGNEACMDPALPFCVDGECSPCSAVVEGTPDEACAMLDEATPLCVDDACVQCTADSPEACGGTTPLCDAETNVCVACEFHEQCQDLDLPACNIATGACFDAAAVTEVDAGDNGAIQTVVDELDDGAEHAIELTGGGGLHTITIDGGKTIAIVSDSSTVRVVGGNTASPIVTVSGAGSTAYLHRLRVDGSNGVGVSVGTGTTLYADSTQVSGNDGGGITLASGSSGFVRNCMVGGPLDGVAVDASSAQLELVYSSVLGSLGDADALLCSSGAGVVVRNSILATRGDNPAQGCSGASVSTTAVEDDAETAWFSDYNGGDARLSAAGQTQFADIAIWEVGDPPFDFEGDARPATDGATDYPGADTVP